MEIVKQAMTWFMKMNNDGSVWGLNKSQKWSLASDNFVSSDITHSKTFLLLLLHGENSSQKQVKAMTSPIVKHYKTHTHTHTGR